MEKWMDKIRKVTPYVPGEQPKDSQMIKLNTNENPYPPSPKAMEAVRALPDAQMRLYPDPAITELVHAIAVNYGLRDEQVFAGVGSDEVLAMAFMTFFHSKKPILFPDITYSFYDIWADLFEIPFECKPLDERFHIKKEDYYGENGGIIFPNPNAPTGVALPLSEIEDILKHNEDVVVIIDEAYIDFGGVSAVELLDRYDNLVVIQTFSKSRSLAGMRIGYAMGNPVLIKFLNDVKYSFNSYTLNRTAIAAGVAAVQDVTYYREIQNKIMETREWTKKELSSLGFTFEDSVANFIFVTHKSVPAKEIQEKLRSRHIYVRYFNKPRINNHLRITIGTQQEMETLMAALREIVTV